jgi:hypothetical protein
MMNGGKKYVVISQEEYERLKETPIKLVNPEKREMKKSEIEMSNVWNRDLPNDEKIRVFTEELNNLKSRYDALLKPKPLEVFMKKKEEEPKKDEKDIIQESIIHSVPKTSKVEAKLVLDYLKLKSNTISWNDMGEIIFHGEVIPGSNITDMIIDTVTNRKRSEISPMFKSVFLKALAEVNMPSKWIKNKEYNQLLQSYKGVKSRNIFKSPDEKKIKLDWSSST